MSIIIKPAEKEEAEKIYDFYRVVCRALENEVYSPLWQFGAYPCLQDIENHINNKNLFIAVRGSEIVSAMAAINHGRYSSLHLFAVLPECRGTALAEKMLQKLIETAKKRKNTKIILDVVKGNVPAEKLYRKIGFTCTGEKYERIERIGNVCFSVYEYIIR